MAKKPISIKIHRPNNFSQVLAVIEKFQEKHSTAWYRGSGSQSHKLVPTIFRHPTLKTAEELNKLERDLASTFSQRSPPFLSQVFSDEWERMFFMQHYGIPTRLLDWTESPFVALYFSLTSCHRDEENKVSDDVAVWMLNPSSWNKAALSDISYGGGILDSKKEQVKSYSPNAELDERKVTPILIYGTHNSSRIVAQRGMFALFGKSTEPMEDMYNKIPITGDALQKIIIDKNRVDEIAASLFRKGISDSTVYPDLQGLSLELRRVFGF